MPAVSLTSPRHIYDFVGSEMGRFEQEHLRILLLDIKNHPLRSYDLYIGTKDRSVANIGEMFREAVRENAAAIVVLHNHPSGDPSPSAEDLRLTRDLRAAGVLLDIPCLDHLVVGKEGVQEAPFVSLRETSGIWDRPADGR